MNCQNTETVTSCQTPTTNNSGFLLIIVLYILLIIIIGSKCGGVC